MQKKYINILLIIQVNLSLFAQLSQTEDNKSFKNFLWGVSIAEYQNSGEENTGDSNWTQWEKTKFPNGKEHISKGQRSGKSCDFWNLYKQDINLIKNLGLNSLRFSIEWSRIEPQEGQFDEEALKHYDDLCTELINSGITPLITLHHFTHPTWFEKMGAFENEENIKYFIRFSKKVFERLSNKVTLWCTINEPNIYAFQGYIRGVFPPGRTNILLAAKVLRNLMVTHSYTYDALKNMPNGQKCQIGFVHQYLEFQGYSNWNILENTPGFFLNYFLNTAILHYCKTGYFKLGLPILLNYEFKDSKNQTPMDFIGLNYYSRAVLKSQLSLVEPIIPTCYPDEIMTDMPYAIYPQGLYFKIKEVSKIGVPIYITENGIADQLDNKREFFINQYLGSLIKAKKDGYDVRAYFHWTLMDNDEWDKGRDMKFGLYSHNPETQERTLKEGAKHYANFIKNYSK